jgi:hypothetical membrane protein
LSFDCDHDLYIKKALNNSQDRTVWNRALLMCGVAMPAIYVPTLITSCTMNPGFNLLHREPSELGCADAICPLIYDIGMVATAIAGLLAGGALVVAPGIRRSSPWNICAGATILLSSVGLAMAGLFPLPSLLHYGFGLTTAAILTPLLGAASLRSLGRHVAAALLLVTMMLIVGLVVAKAPPLLPGVLMLMAIAFLCWSIGHPHRAAQVTLDA